MDIDTYLRNIEVIYDIFCSNTKYVNKRPNPIEPYLSDEIIINMILEMIEIKKQLITKHEINISNIVNNSRIDSLNVDSETKLIMIAIYNEICFRANEKRFLCSMEKYKFEQPIFRDNDLYNYVRNCKELINYDKLQWNKVENVCQYENKYFIANGFLKYDILNFIHNECANYIKFIRIEHYFCSDAIPTMKINLEALRPVNPLWIKNLTLFKGQETGGHYILQYPIEVQNKLDKLKCWEYDMLGIRSLEIHAQRNNSGNLSMMIEEILEKKVYESYYIAKCIHLDSNNVVGTNIDDAILNHIDLALNIYDTEAYAMRKKQSLANGRVLDATLRTHILRLEKVPFKLLINLSYLFFESQYLTLEWITEQFF